MKTMTFTSKQVSRGCDEFGPSSLVYTDTVCEDGTVLTTVKGECDGEYVNQTGTHTTHTPVDFDRIRAARLASGWTEVL